MSLIVKKFGGTSVADAQRLNHVAKLIVGDYKKGHDIVVVVSAQGDHTDRLINQAAEINPDGASKREMDVLMSAGEQISASLLAMAIEAMGCPAVSLMGWQAGFKTDSNYTFARIKRLEPDRIKAELAKKNVVVIAGFQGINQYDDITTFGRGGSDTSAVAVAATLKANLCQIYTDVDGVYTADPRLVTNAKKIPVITYDEMLELASLGAQVLNSRSVEMAKKYNVELEVRSSFTDEPGTLVKENVKMEKMVIRGVAKDTDLSTIYITGLNDAPGIAFKIFNRLAQHGIVVDLIMHTAESHGKTDIMFSIKGSDCTEAIKAIESLRDSLNFEAVEHDDDVAKISVVGSGIASHPGVAAKMFEALYEYGISIKMIATGEIKLSVIVAAKDADRGVKAVHDAFIQ